MDSRLLHYVSLDQAGGVERHCVEFLRAAAAAEPRWQHAVLAAGQPMHAAIATGLDPHLIAGHEKYLGPLKLPAVPKAFRRAAVRRIVRRVRPDVTLIWNRPVRCRPLFEAYAPPSWLYWEHGSAWYTDAAERKQSFYEACPWIIANSRAASRVLALRWRREARVTVCRNALRPSLAPAKPRARTLPPRPLRLGFAGRLVPIKGGALAVHALARLHARRIPAELHVAGLGPSEAGLRTLARQLGVADSIVWHGLVEQMGVFLDHIDCLVHPALREPFGLVCLEAAARGCPVVAAAVDGIPEVVRDQVTGFLITPELPLGDYAALGGATSGLPEFVYDPARDRLTAPRLISPDALAAAVERLLDGPTFAAQSARAVETVRTEFDFDAHVRAVMTVVGECRGQPSARQVG